MVKTCRLCGDSTSLDNDDLCTDWFNCQRRQIAQLKAEIKIIQHNAMIAISTYQEVLGRFISRAEALQIARKILEQAERERLIFAEYEAARGIQWDNCS